MSKSSRARIDYSPAPAALEALRAAQALHPQDSLQAALDRLVITGLAALVHPPWRPPALHGRDRDRWQLPVGLAALP